MSDKTNEAEIVWVADSLEVVSGFPKNIKKKIGEELRRLQNGGRALNARPMKSIGAKVAELRQRDNNGWYRTIYFGVIKGQIFVLHSFVKKSAKTPKNDLSIAESRYKEIKASFKSGK